MRYLRLAAGVVCLLAVLASSAPSAPAPSPVALENAKPGTTRWLVGTQSNGEVEGYASEVSVAPAGKLHLHISLNPAGHYRIEIYRLGWYQGRGARLYGCVPSCTTDEPGVPRPVPPFDPHTGLVRAGWPVTDTLPIGPSWLSGYYLAVVRVTRSAQQLSYRVPFIVREAPGRAAPILVQASTNTWQAYNSWGGRSLYYPDMTGVTNNHVSFDRPYADMPMSDSSMMRYELPLIRFIERNGLDAAYQSDADTDAAPSSLRSHRLVVVAGHAEYWTQRERDAFELAREHGVNLAFMGANIGYWRIRYENQRRTIVEYRLQSQDPLHITGKFRKLATQQPECELLGVQFDQDDGSIGSTHPLSVISTAGPWFRGTGLRVGQALPGLASGEWDNTVPGCTPLNARVLFGYYGAPANAESVRYVDKSGATIFSAGTLFFNFALDDPPGYQSVAGLVVPGIQRFVRNMFVDLAGAGQSSR